MSAASLWREGVGRRAVGALVVALAALAFGAASASAQAPWWHLRSGTLPTYLRAGLAQDQVFQLTVSATGGEVVLVDETSFARAFVKWDASALEMREALEHMYGAGSVEVSGGPGDASGGNPYAIKFVGAMGDQAVSSLQVLSGLLEGGSAQAQLTAVTPGRPDGEIVVLASNLGDASANGAASPIQILDTLPGGLRAVSIEGIAGVGGHATPHGPVSCVLATLSCVDEGELPPYEQIEVRIGVVVEGGGPGEVNRASVFGGEAPLASASDPLTFSDAPVPFGVEKYELGLEEEGGAPDTQAGSHPFQFTTTFDLNREAKEGSYFGTELLPRPAGGQAKDLSFRLPPGLIGNPAPLSRCTLAQFVAPRGGQLTENLCPPQTAVGVAMVTVDIPHLSLNTFSVPVFNLEPTFGEPARFGFLVESSPVYIDTSVRTGEDYGISAHSYNTTQAIEFLSATIVFWGTPGDPRHDRQRGWDCYAEDSGGSVAEPCKLLEETSPPPFMTMPTMCGAPLQSSMEVDSWANPSEALLAGASEPLQALDGCNRLQFDPSVEVTPDGTAGSTPTGLTVDEHVPQESLLAAKGLAEANVKGLSVTLPEGLAFNPAAADGLQACSLEQVGLQSAAETTCPEAAKIATVKMNVPLLSEPVEGAAYLAEQDQNPFGSLVAMYIVAENKREGVRIKAAGEVVENPVTGQLTAHFEHDNLFAAEPSSWQYLPLAPFEDVELHFFGGDRAPLATPAKCGAYRTTATFTPWSAGSGEEAAATVSSSSTFDVTSGPNGSPCRNPLPFSPTLTTGTTSIQAGGFSPFEMTMSREDGEQTLRGVALHLPLGLLGTLASVKLCGEQQANEGTCGPESEIGETIVSVGVGGDPFTVKGGRVYITGPYRGAPFGLSIVNPAKAGPFDLGKVVVRAKLEVDEETAAITVTTDDEGPYKIPTIIDGIPLEIRHVNVNINRPGFTFNATNCNPSKITGVLTSAEGSTSSISVPYQVTNCAALSFKPEFKVSTEAKTSRTEGATLRVKLTLPSEAPGTKANVREVKVSLPKALPSPLKTLQKACTEKVFDENPSDCPVASRVGEAKVTTPVLDGGLRGPAYFVSHGDARYPELIMVLVGEDGVTVDVHGETFISKRGITTATFSTVPDVPFETFELELPKREYPALSANGNLCQARAAGKLLMPTEMVGQNGAKVTQQTEISVTGCGKVKKKTAHKHKKHHAAKKKH